MNKIKIGFNKKYISQDEIAELGLDNTHADILEHDFNPKEPVNSAFFNQILLILGNLGIGVITNIIANELLTTPEIIMNTRLFVAYKELGQII